ncbi:MAG: hypothetical protein HN356_11025 [Calditrichaeota bacterium]|jgi:hypothetical protein|nr:hypothetical protein [Calditrichota bacterium]MBT7618880.1 hypothetical protein [Calditrichota bacterium]MBT7788738.1 hypothetical protein [Calditrichota bacterium]
MNTGQTLLTMGALMLICIIILNFNVTSNNIGTSLDFNRFRLEGLSILTSHIEQLSQYYFDEVSTDTINEKRVNNFSQDHQLGFDNGDNNVIDDIDDFHGLTVVDTGMSGVIYNVNFEVDYVNLQSGIITHSGNREYHKRVSLSVSDAFDPPLVYSMSGSNRVRDTLKVEVVISYWFFN